MSKKPAWFEVQREIIKMFPIGSGSASLFDRYPEQMYLDYKKTIQNHIPFKKEENNISLLNFLHAGCLKFDRFTPPTPFVFEPIYDQNFELFLNALIKAEGSITINSTILLLRKIRHGIYRNFHLKPFYKYNAEELVIYREKINQFFSPDHPAKRLEFEEEKNKINAIVNGIFDNSLRTVIKTQIPYILHISPLCISFYWENIPIQLKTIPTFGNSQESFVQFTSGAQQSIGPSRWQAGTTELEYSIASFVDCNLFAEPIQSLLDHDLPVKGWPICFVLAFNLLNNVAWRLRLEHGGEKQWIPAPRDLGNIEWSIKTAKIDKIDWNLKGSPALLTRGFTPPNEIIEIDLDQIKPITTSERCHSQAGVYFEMGQNEEAIFWLNVGIEALFEERFIEFAQELNNDSLVKDITSPKAFWAQAEEIICKQFPEMSGKIKWPSSNIHVSMYAKLRYIYNTVRMKTSYSKLNKNYEKICKYRNDLFHGRPTMNISTKDVKSAFNAFRWIKENFHLEDKTGVPI